MKGRTLNLYGVQKYFEHEDREVRRAAVRAYSDFYHSNEKRLEEIWEELITIRNQMGKNLGYANFIPVGYMQQGTHGLWGKRGGSVPRAGAYGTRTAV